MWGVVIQRQARPAAEECFFLWPENEPAWALWHTLQTQWRTGGMGGREGLDYPAVDVAMRVGPVRVRPKDRRRRWAEIQVMERAALRTWAARAARKGG